MPIFRAGSEGPSLRRAVTVPSRGWGAAQKAKARRQHTRNQGLGQPYA